RLAARSGRDCVRSVLFEFVSEENPPVENYANPKSVSSMFSSSEVENGNKFVLGAGCCVGVLHSLGSLLNSFVIIFVVTVLLAALDFWVVKNVSGRILVGGGNEINDLGESVWKFESLDQEQKILTSFTSFISFVCVSVLARMNRKTPGFLVDALPCSSCVVSLGIFSLIRFQADYLLLLSAFACPLTRLISSASQSARKMKRRTVS
ncbi:LOW QUALITY PROTEIN: hypothetical protein HID58_080853, partial [Brassica napus]